MIDRPHSGGRAEPTHLLCSAARLGDQIDIYTDASPQRNQCQLSRRKRSRCTQLRGADPEVGDACGQSDERGGGWSLSSCGGPAILARLTVTAEQEGENLSGLSNNPDKEIFVVRDNGTTCLMVEFAVRFIVPFDVLALNGIDLITENAYLALPRGADIEGKCGEQEAQISISWRDNAYTLRIYFVKETRNKGEKIWKVNKVLFVYDSSEQTHFLNPYNPGKHTASSHSLSALVTPAGRSYVCSAKQTLTLISSDHQKGVTVAMSDIQIQPFDISSDFVFSEAYKCITDQREQLEETLPLILGFILGLIIVITLAVYHFHLKLTVVNQPQLPRDRSMYKNM
ncbi:hypothetical protein DPEC_G00089480 [Dallia pectoralis]|uniref:Uncharacterized protein n=1 Tax=Dallia pectoralis TaxID=75939 RepID=A0ACC2H0R2_DALPE|nr:hypothetical protein DPEC_G00089480 [Dallia pectoralis]